MKLWTLCILLGSLYPAETRAQGEVQPDTWTPDGSAMVKNGSELLAALQAGETNIALAGAALNILASAMPAMRRRCYIIPWREWSADMLDSCSITPAAAPAARRQRHLAALRLAAD